MVHFGLYFWFGFLAFVVLALAVDLGIFNRKEHAPSMQEALVTTTSWIVLALLFACIIYYYTNFDKTAEFVTGYLVELSLSMDNVFVFALLFRYFKVPLQYQHRVLFWGVIGAIVMRFIMIMAGIYIIKKFHFVFYIFGAFLVFSAYKLITAKQSNVKLADSALVKFLHRHARFTKEYHKSKFLIRQKGKIFATPLLMVLILIEKTDLVFAIDSIPAILAITQDSFIVYSSNIFAILGLRALYFLLANIMDKFIYLKYGLAAILGFIGIKMILMAAGYHINTLVSLGVIFSTLVVSILASQFSHCAHKKSK